VPFTRGADGVRDMSMPVPARGTAPARKLRVCELRPHGRCQMKTCHAVRGTK